MIKKIILIVVVSSFIGVIFLFFTNAGVGLLERFDNWRQNDTPIPPENEIVMSPDSTIEATTKIGKIIIKSGKGFKRYYTWEGATRSVVMWPREYRWIGSFGLYYPGPGFHWKEHNGINRGVLEEGQQHFNSIDEAKSWLKLPYHSDCIYRDDGLVVCFSKTLERHQLNVEVWQIYIEGKTPSAYKDLFTDYKDKIYYVDGHKTNKLEGSNNNAIHAS